MSTISQSQFAGFLDVVPLPPILPRMLKWIHRRVHTPASEANLSSCHVPWSRLKSVMGCSVPSWAHLKMAGRQTVTLLPVLSTRFYGMICLLKFKAWKKDWFALKPQSIHCGIRPSWDLRSCSDLTKAHATTGLASQRCWFAEICIHTDASWYIQLNARRSGTLHVWAPDRTLGNLSLSLP